MVASNTMNEDMAREISLLREMVTDLKRELKRTRAMAVTGAIRTHKADIVSAITAACKKRPMSANDIVNSRVVGLSARRVTTLLRELTDQGMLTRTPTVVRRDNTNVRVNMYSVPMVRP